MREPSIFYMQNIHWKELEKELLQTGDPSMPDLVTILPVRDPEFKHYMVISISDTADQLLESLQGTQLENAGLKDRLAGMPKEPVFGNRELLNLLK